RNEAALEPRHRLGEARGQLALDPALELLALAGRQTARTVEPIGSLPATPTPGLGPGLPNSVRYLEGRAVQAERGFRAGQLLRAEGLAMGLRGAGLLRRAVADRGLAGDERRALGGLGVRDRTLDGLSVVPVDAERAPARRLEAPHLVDRVRKRQRPVDRDAVVVE